MEKIRMKLALVMIALVIPSLVLARAKGVKVAEQDAPRPVLEAVHQKFPAAKLRSLEKLQKKGKVIYKARLKVGDRKLSLRLTPEGQVLVQKEKIKEANLPREVKAGFEASAYARWKVRRIKRVFEKGDEQVPVYSYLLENGGKQSRVDFDAAGKILVATKKKAGK
jgi:hypothetical protein